MSNQTIYAAQRPDWWSTLSNQGPQDSLRLLLQPPFFFFFFCHLWWWPAIILTLLATSLDYGVIEQIQYCRRAGNLGMEKDMAWTVVIGEPNADSSTVQGSAPDKAEVHV